MIIKSKQRCDMEQYIIKGGNPLVGEVEIGGAKKCGACNFGGCNHDG